MFLSLNVPGVPPTPLPPSPSGPLPSAENKNEKREFLSPTNFSSKKESESWLPCVHLLGVCRNLTAPKKAGRAPLPIPGGQGLPLGLPLPSLPPTLKLCSAEKRAWCRSCQGTGFQTPVLVVITCSAVSGSSSLSVPISEMGLQPQVLPGEAGADRCLYYGAGSKIGASPGPPAYLCTPNPGCGCSVPCPFTVWAISVPPSNQATPAHEQALREELRLRQGQGA